MREIRTPGTDRTSPRPRADGQQSINALPPPKSLSMACPHVRYKTPPISRVAQTKLRTSFAVVLARPCRTYPIAPPSIRPKRSHHQNLGANILSHMRLASHAGVFLRSAAFPLPGRRGKTAGRSVYPLWRARLYAAGSIRFNSATSRSGGGPQLAAEDIDEMYERYTGGVPSDR